MPPTPGIGKAIRGIIMKYLFETTATPTIKDRERYSNEAPRD